MRAGDERRPRAVRRGWPYAPLLLRTVDASLAAALAWALVLPLGGLADRYPYYAPLGAVIGVSTTVVGSARGAAATVRNLALGAALGTSVQLLALPDLLGLALVVAVGTALSGSRHLTNGASWIVYSSVFVLIIGGDSPWEYGLAYAGLTSLGALVGIAVVVALPPLLLTPGARAVAEAGTVLADQLDDLAGGLTGDEPPTQHQWARRQRDLAPVMRRLDDAVQAVLEARRANWRARWWHTRTARQREVAAVVARSYTVVQHLVLLLVREELSGRATVALGPELRPLAAAALAQWAVLLREVTRGGDGDDAARELEDDLAALADAVRRSAARSGLDHLEAATVTTGVRLGLEIARGA